jgi:hypothetical protein
LCSRAPRIEITRCGVSKSLSSEPDEAREVVFGAGLEGDLGAGMRGRATMNVSRTPYVARRAAHCTPCPAHRGLFSTGLGAMKPRRLRSTRRGHGSQRLLEPQKITVRVLHEELTAAKVHVTSPVQLLLGT